MGSSRGRLPGARTRQRWMGRSGESMAFAIWHLLVLGRAAGPTIELTPVSRGSTTSGWSWVEREDVICLEGSVTASPGDVVVIEYLL